MRVSYEVLVALLSGPKCVAGENVLSERKRALQLSSEMFYFCPGQKGECGVYIINYFEGELSSVKKQKHT